MCAVDETFARNGTEADVDAPFVQDDGNDQNEMTDAGDLWFPSKSISDQDERTAELSALFRGRALNKMVLLTDNKPVGGYHPDYLRRLGHCQAPGLHTTIDVVVGRCIPEHLVIAFRSLNGSKTVRIADAYVPLLDGTVTSITMDAAALPSRTFGGTMPMQD
ncbi:hypothetical protein E4U54_001682 [Claviceps lovelessii]|nr:hypothetical protein E4U54_001682 [Claviceps lovelessii]